MSLKSVQTYEVNGNGVLDPVDGLIFNTDTSGTVILGGRCNNSEIIDTACSWLQHNADGSWGGPYVNYGTSAGIGAGISNYTVNAQASYIGAGQENIISGQTTVCFIKIGGASSFKNESFGTKSFIGAGAANKIYSPKSAIIGGHGNNILGTTCFSGPGIDSAPKDEYKCYPVFMQEGDWHPWDISNGPGYNVIAGGKNNYLNGIFSVIGGGLDNCICSERAYTPNGYGGYWPGQLSGQYNFLGGGFSNLINNSCTSTIAGGNDNSIDKSHNASIVGGCRNLISGGLSSDNNSLVGGFWNSILGGAYQFMGGGYRNLISGASFSALVGGCQNSIISSNIRGRASDQLDIIVGGVLNTISGCLNTILGGSTNYIQGSCNSILAGSQNIIKNSSCVTILAGYRISGIHAGSTIVGDQTNRFKTSDGINMLTVDFASGITLKSSAVPVEIYSYGVSGQIAFDKNYLYRHNGDHWTRTAMSIW